MRWALGLHADLVALSFVQGPIPLLAFTPQPATRIVAGRPPGTPGQTNALRVHRIGDAIAGQPWAER